MTTSFAKTIETMFAKMRKSSAVLAPAVDRRAEAEKEAAVVESEEPALGNTEKSYWEKRIPVIACGAGLFSDGYLNSVSALALSIGQS